MTRETSAKDSQENKTKEQPVTPENPEQSRQLITAQLGWDILGLGCFVLALITLLGLLNLTRGAFMSPWVKFLRRGFGDGSYFFVGVIALVGFLLLRQRYQGIG